MRQKLRLLIFFQRRLIVPTAGTAVGIGIAGAYFTFQQSFAVGFLVAGPLFHFMLYDVSESSDRFFYYNLGFTKRQMWTSTIGINLLICLTVLAV